MRRLRRALVILLGTALGAAMPGCAIFSDRSAEPADRLSQSTTRRDVALASYEEPVDEEMKPAPLKTEDFYPANIGTTVKRLSGRGPDHHLARELYGEGEELYRQAVETRAQNMAADVEQLFFEASEKFAGAADRWPESALEEDALFRAGESQFFADRYVKANEYFEKLLKKYPNSRYLDLVGARRFRIAQYWLELNDQGSSLPLGLNVTDKQRPWSDAFGHAVRIYDRMRIDDPTGKLADDATIAAANAHFLKGDFLKADQYYTDLRTHFPSSEHQFMAHYLGLQAKLRGYRGPDFTGDALEQAEKLVKQVRRQFPSEYRQHEDEIEKAYREIRYRKAEREWNMAKYYNRRHEYGAARFYYDLILKDYDDTPFADQAREQIGEIAGKPLAPPQRLSWLVNLFPDKEIPQPLIVTSPGETKLR